jgi:transcriptional regulator with XRE-family HTH domain
MSQLVLGRRIAMHHNYLGAIERGEVGSPGLETVDRIARGLDVRIAVLAESYATAPSEPGLRVDVTGGRPDRLTEGHDSKALGEAIRIVRRRLDLTQTQLADASGLHRNHVGSIEVARNRAGASSRRAAHTRPISVCCPRCSLAGRL